MIILSVMLIYKLLKRFPLIMLFIYSFATFGPGSVELEWEGEKEIVEYVDSLHESLELSQINGLDNSFLSSIPVSSFIIFENLYYAPFLKTARFKLYILYSSLLVGRF